MKKIWQAILGIIILSLAIIYSYTEHQRAPAKTTTFLESKGYQNIQITKTMFVFGFDLCSKDVQKVAFKASLQGRPVTGYVCLEPLFSYSIHED